MTGVQRVLFRSAWHLYVVRTSDRDALQARLSEAGIGTLIHYPIPPHMQAAYTSLGIENDILPVANILASEVLSLPIGPHLRDTEAKKIIRTVIWK